MFFSIIETRKAGVPAWKADTIASMVYGPDDLLRSRLREASQSQALEKVGELRVALEDHERGVALSGVAHGGHR